MDNLEINPGLENNEGGEKEGWLQLTIEAPGNMSDVKGRIKVLDDYLQKFGALITHKGDEIPDGSTFEVRCLAPERESMINRLIESQGFNIVERTEK